MLPTTTFKITPVQVLPIPYVVQVLFPGNSNKLYSYHCDIEGVQAGDYVIVASPHAQTGWERNPDFFSTELKGHPTVVRVFSTEQSVGAISKAAKWIIQKVDIDAYVARLNHEQQVEVLKHRITEEKKKALEAFELAKLRELNPTLGVLVDQLAALTGQVLEPKPTTVREHKRAAPRTKKAPVKTSVKKGANPRAKRELPRRTKKA
jgi:hypothetical protein